LLFSTDLDGMQWRKRTPKGAHLWTLHQPALLRLLVLL
jgi:hypothetical protein